MNTNKIDLIRAEVERIQLYTQSEVLKQVLDYIDSLQEEPVSDIDFEQELYKAFGQVKDFTLGLRIAKRFYDMGKNHQEPVSEELEKAAKQYEEDAIFYAGLNISDFFKAGAKWQKQRDNNDANHDLVEQIKTQQMYYEKGMTDMKQQMMAKAFDFTKEHNTACVLASECLRGNGWFSKERDFNDLFRHLSCVDKLFEGKFSGKTKVIVIKEE